MTFLSKLTLPYLPIIYLKIEPTKTLKTLQKGVDSKFPRLTTLLVKYWSLSNSVQKIPYTLKIFFFVPLIKKLNTFKLFLLQTQLHDSLLHKNIVFLPYMLIDFVASVILVVTIHAVILWLFPTL